MDGRGGRMPESPWSGRSRESTAREKPLVATRKRGWSRSVLSTQGKNAGHPALPLPERLASRLEDRRCGSGVSANWGTWYGSTGAFEGRSGIKRVGDLCVRGVSLGWHELAMKKRDKILYIFTYLHLNVNMFLWEDVLLGG